MGNLPLRALLFLLGAFTLFSAGLKGRSSTSAGRGVSVLTLVEGAAGVVLVVTTLPGVVPLSVAAGVGIGTAVLVFVSTMVHLMQVRALSQARDKTEGKRLYSTIKYGLADGPPEEGVAAPEENQAAPEESQAAPEESQAAPEEGQAAPEGGPAESEAGPAEPEAGPAEPEAVDPITAALESGHFDEEAFLRSTSSEKGTQGDGDTAPEGENLPEENGEP